MYIKQKFITVTFFFTDIFLLDVEGKTALVYEAARSRNACLPSSDEYPERSELLQSQLARVVVLWLARRSKKGPNTFPKDTGKK